MKLLAMMFGLGTGMVLTGAQDAERVYSVCELLVNPQQFNGKTVKVRGIVEGGMHGAWLKSDDCPEPFYVGENSLPREISLSYQSEYGSAPPPNTAHMERVERQIREMLRKTKSGILMLTYTGIFETRTDWKVIILAGEPRLWGLGHLNTFPAQLVVTDKADPVVAKRKVTDRRRPRR